MQESQIKYQEQRQKQLGLQTSKRSSPTKLRNVSRELEEKEISRDVIYRNDLTLIKNALVEVLSKKNRDKKAGKQSNMTMPDYQLASREGRVIMDQVKQIVLNSDRQLGIYDEALYEAFAGLQQEHATDAQG